ncbi:hypothetical protein M440DRAFT_62488 [Trichoderma longibrachiatum ATCC 18648]|uniref:Guanylate kinase-like domain-containing protein n=1 Tax=Trichoderma longibrachiatum ATCC 18648 TaxID=983965 RepID=A0A2T4BPU4_TRILO|nr:hypothetical protein M440DRAFT_62488 [Trichoderma longibrachiatum ATCC 18648]
MREDDPASNLQLNKPVRNFIYQSSTAEPTYIHPITSSGPSGVGKGALLQLIEDARPGLFTRTISDTSRQP